MAQVIKDLVNWLQQWFYTEDEVDTILNTLKNNAGINILANTETFEKNTISDTASGTLTGEYYQRGAIRTGTNNGSSNYSLFVYNNIQDGANGDFNVGDKFTFSIWARGTGKLRILNNKTRVSTSIAYAGSKVINTNGTAISSSYSDGNCEFDLTNNWQRFYVTWEINPSSTTAEIQNTKANIILRLPSGTSTEIFACGVLYEKGDVAHEWIYPINNIISRLLTLERQ